MAVSGFYDYTQKASDKEKKQHIQKPHLIFQFVSKDFWIRRYAQDLVAKSLQSFLQGLYVGRNTVDIREINLARQCNLHRM